MPDNVLVNPTVDSVTILDMETAKEVTISEESLTVYEVDDNQTLVDIGEYIQVNDGDESVIVNEQIDEFSPKFSEVYQPSINNTYVTNNFKEEDKMYASRVDFIDDYNLYRGEAEPGTLDTEPLWRIRKIVIGADNDVTTTFADGDEDFDNIWTSRLTLSYS